MKKNNNNQNWKTQSFWRLNNMKIFWNWELTFWKNIETTWVLAILNINIFRFTYVLILFGFIYYFLKFWFFEDFKTSIFDFFKDFKISSLDVLCAPYFKIENMTPTTWILTNWNWKIEIEKKWKLNNNKKIIPRLKYCNSCKLDNWILETL